MLTEDELLLLSRLEAKLDEINESLQFLGLVILSGNTELKNKQQSYEKAFMEWFREKEFMRKK